MAYSNYSDKTSPRSKRSQYKPNVKPLSMKSGHAANKGVQSSVAGGKFKKMSLPGGKPAVLAEPVQQNMDRTIKQPAIKKLDYDNGKTGAQMQLAKVGSDKASAIALKQKDNTVPANTQAKFSKGVNKDATALMGGEQITKKGSKQIQGSTKTATNMNYAKAAGKNVDGAGQRSQTPAGPDGAAGSKKVAFAAMKKGTKNKVVPPKVKGVSAAGKNGAIGTAGGDKNGHVTGGKYNFAKKRGVVTTKKVY